MDEDDYKIVIFVKGKASEDILRLCRESELIKNFSVEILDIDSSQAYMKKIAYRCISENYCAITDANNCLLLTLSMLPVSFFHLKEILTSLGYSTTAKAICWTS